jgi:Protein of unknown function (DUF3987)
MNNNTTNIRENFENGNFLSDNIENIVPITKQTMYDALPNLLKNCVATLTDETDKEVFMYGAFGCISAIMTNVKGFYDGKLYTPHLYIYVLGSAGAGKGALEYAKQLITPIDAKIKEISQDLETGKPKKRLFIPANTSSTGAIDLLAQNEGNGIIFETEGDTLANVFKSDFGNYSDSFRKAFGHETISLARVSDRKNICIDKPQLATVLSSTFGQLLNLIPSTENGLFSRFLFYELESTNQFKNPFKTHKRKYQGYFNEVSDQLLSLYTKLHTLGDVEVRLTEAQENSFIDIFQQWKDEIRATLDDNQKTDLDGTIHRLGLITFRLCMIFTVLRNFENGTLTKEMQCIDMDFYNALQIVSTSKENAITIYNRLPKPTWLHTNTSNKLVQRAKDIERAVQLRKEGKTLGQIAEIVLGDKKKKPNIQFWLKEHDTTVSAKNI